MSEWILLSQDEMRRRLARYRGINPKCIPKEKSTKLCIVDFEHLSKIRSDFLYIFLAGKRNFGLQWTRQLSRALYLADNGYVQKLQYKHYIIHDEPFQPPRREMRVSVGSNGVELTKTQKDVAPPTMPNFMDIFKEKK